VRNKGDISDKLWTARRETETMLNACLHQQNLLINEEKTKEQHKDILLEDHLNETVQQHDLTVPMTVCGRENL